MDRRFFENDNVEDLSKNESQKNFQKIDEEDEVLKENYMWSDEEDDFSSETDFNVMSKYTESYEEDNLYYDAHANETEESERGENYSSLEENTVMEVKCDCDYQYLSVTVIINTVIQTKIMIAIINTVIQKKIINVIAMNQIHILAQINLLAVMIIIVIHLTKIKDIEKIKNLI